MTKITFVVRRWGQPWRCDRSSDMCWLGMLPNS